MQDVSPEQAVLCIPARPTDTLKDAGFIDRRVVLFTLADLGLLIGSGSTASSSCDNSSCSACELSSLESESRLNCCRALRLGGCRRCG